MRLVGKAYDCPIVEFDDMGDLLNGILDYKYRQGKEVILIVNWEKTEISIKDWLIKRGALFPSTTEELTKRQD